MLRAIKSLFKRKSGGKGEPQLSASLSSLPDILMQKEGCVDIEYSHSAGTAPRPLDRGFRSAREPQTSACPYEEANPKRVSEELAVGKTQGDGDARKDNGGSEERKSWWRRSHRERMGRADAKVSARRERKAAVNGDGGAGDRSSLTSCGRPLDGDGSVGTHGAAVLASPRAARSPSGVSDESPAIGSRPKTSALVQLPSVAANELARVLAQRRRARSVDPYRAQASADVGHGGSGGSSGNMKRDGAAAKDRPEVNAKAALPRPNPRRGDAADKRAGSLEVTEVIGTAATTSGNLGVPNPTYSEDPSACSVAASASCTARARPARAAVSSGGAAAPPSSAAVEQRPRSAEERATLCDNPRRGGGHPSAWSEGKGPADGHGFDGVMTKNCQAQDSDDAAAFPSLIPQTKVAFTIRDQWPARSGLVDGVDALRAVSGRSEGARSDACGGGTGVPAVEAAASRKAVRPEKAERAPAAPASSGQAIENAAGPGEADATCGTPVAAAVTFTTEGRDRPAAVTVVCRDRAVVGTALLGASVHCLAEVIYDVPSSSRRPLEPSHSADQQPPVPAAVVSATCRDREVTATAAQGKASDCPSNGIYDVPKHGSRLLDRSPSADQPQLAPAADARFSYEVPCYDVPPTPRRAV